MFQLIVVVISIILVVVLAAATIYYGGNSFSDSSAKATYLEKVNKASQIEAALHLYYSHNGYYPGGTSEQIITVLVGDDYLVQSPDGEWAIGYEVIVRGIEDEGQCESINRFDGRDVEERPCPLCTDEAYDTWPACRST